MDKSKTLGDYISSGRHEFVAHVRNMMSLNNSSRSNHGTWGNDLGKIHLGVLVCDRKPESERDEKGDVARFFYKSSPRNEGDSDIMLRDLAYSAKVISEVPLGLEVHSFHSGWHLEMKSKEFKEARRLLQRYGLY